MKLKKLLEEINEDLLLEVVRKEGDRYYIYSHRTGKKIGRKSGYATATQAIGGLLGMMSKGGFYNKSAKVKRAMISSYRKRHSI